MFLDSFLRQHSDEHQKGKAKAEPPSGIPTKYIRPVEVPAKKRKPGRQLSAYDWDRFRAFALSKVSHFHVGTLVSVVGRVDFWFERQDSFLKVERVVPLNSSVDQENWGCSNEGHIQALFDPDLESKHMLKALHLSATQYSKEFELPPLYEKAAQECRKPLRRLSSTPPRADQEEENQNQINPRKKIRTYGGSPDPPKRKAASVPNNEMSRKAEGTRATSTAAASPEKHKGKSEKNFPHYTQSERRQIQDILHRRRRRLRDYRKLTDESLTEDVLQIYVVEHIKTYCGGDIDLHPGSHAPHCQPTAFTIAYLLHVKHLHGFAERIVRSELLARNGTNQESRSSLKTTETIGEKVERLLSFVVHKILAEGTFVVADPELKVEKPFNGHRPSPHDLRQCDPEGLLIWSEREARSLVRQQKKSAFSREWTVTEAYQLVTPSLLAQPILHMARSHLQRQSRSHGKAWLQKQSPDFITAQLREMDERWKFLSVSSVIDALDSIRSFSV